ncbi:hypothetical protein AAG570_005614 [Ranatra chinensis]|uniref:Uncharacterized protein n=1 Tax=Ranatra chinensis TaxID=642074 RepID=A0ABD0YGB8_9HEMI
MLERSLNIIQQSEDKTNKRSALGELRKIISQTETSGLGDIYTRISKSLHLCFQDRFELCREQSILITTDMLNTLEPDPKYLISLIPALQRRIVCEASQEPSEEIRLLLVKLLHVIIEKYDNLVTPFTNDIIEMLAATIADSAPVVKKESCSCAIALSKVPSQAFYTCSPKLIKPLVDTAGHQHWRVRCIVVETIGSVIQNGDNKCIPDVTTPLAKRLFDDSFHVRMAVTRVVGNWMISLPDRYSFFPVLLPLILTSLTDENDDIVKETEFLWTTAGKQYLNENEKDFKDRIDYISDIMEHYPPNVTRPHLGCRILVEREGGKFLLALGREICDWVASVRIKSAQLLTQVVLHAEASITQQVHKIIGPMCKAATDEEPPVVQNVILAAEYIGYFVPASVHCKLIIETMGEANYGQLRVVSGLVRGSKKDELVEHLTAVGRLLGHSTFEAEEQIAMLNLIESVFFVCGQDSLVIGEDIFLSIISVAGMATAQEILEMALGNLIQSLLLFTKFVK